MATAARKRTAQTTKIPTATTKPKPKAPRSVSTAAKTPVRKLIVPQTPAQLDALLATPMTLGSTILPPDAQVMTVKELAQLLRISERNASTLVLRGEIASMKVGQQLRRIPLFAVQEYIRSHTGAA